MFFFVRQRTEVNAQQCRVLSLPRRHLLPGEWPGGPKWARGGEANLEVGILDQWPYVLPVKRDLPTSDGNGHQRPAGLSKWEPLSFGRVETEREPAFWGFPKRKLVLFSKTSPVSFHWKDCTRTSICFSCFSRKSCCLFYASCFPGG